MMCTAHLPGAPDGVFCPDRLPATTDGLWLAGGGIVRYMAPLPDAPDGFLVWPATKDTWPAPCGHGNGPCGRLRQQAWLRGQRTGGSLRRLTRTQIISSRPARP